MNSIENVIELTGSAREMGRAHGECLREAIASFAEDRLRLCIEEVAAAGRSITPGDVLACCDRLVRVQARFAPGAHDEFLGIAEAARVTPAMLMIGNGLTDIIDLLSFARARSPRRTEGCTAWLVAPDATENDGVLAGQTWDMHPSAEPYVAVFRRRPDDGPSTLAVTTAGGLSLVGFNDRGIAVGNNNLRSTDVADGLNYLTLIHEALRQTSLAAAMNRISEGPRIAGRNFILTGPGGQIVDVESSATEFEVIQPAGDCYVHTNHYLDDRLRRCESLGDDARSSLYRLTRMGGHLYREAGAITPRSMMAIMSDETGVGDCRICRRDSGDSLRTCAAVVMSPLRGTMWVAKGPPVAGDFREFRL